MKGYDAFAGVVKSGGKTRRAAKMVILDAGHPDVLDFIDSQGARGEEGLGAHRAGLRPELHRRGLRQRLLPERQPHRPRDRRRSCTRSRTTASGRPTRSPTASRWTRYKARDIFRKMAEAAHLCGDPGIQYDTTINDWHTSREHGPDPRVQPVLGVHVPQRHGLQPGQPQPHEVRRGGRRVRRRGLPLRGARLTHHGAGDPGRQRALPDAEDRGEPPPVPAARPRLREPRRAAHEPRPGLRLRRGPQLRGRPHGDHARRGLPPVARHRPRPRRPVRRLRRSTASPFLRVIAQAPRRGLRAARGRRARRPCSSAARTVCDEALELGKQHGYRNAQVTVLAPTGTIAFMMDCDTTGVEPDIALIKYKKLVGEGFLKIVNQTVPAALAQARLHRRRRSRRSSPTSTSARPSRARPDLKPEHLPVFDCAFKPGQRRAVHPLHGPHPDDGRDPAVHLGRHQQDRQHARGRHGRGDRDRSTSRAGSRASRRSRSTATAASAVPAALSTGKKKDGDASAEDDARRSRACAKQLAAAQVEAASPHRRRLPAERTRGHPQVRDLGARGLHHGRPLPGRPARRDLPQDGQGRLHGLAA